MALITDPEIRTVAQMVEETKQHLLGGMRERLNWLDGAINDSTETLTVLDDATPIRPGMLLEVDTELMYVRAVAAKTITVRRGHQGTEAASHDDDAEVRIDPAYPTGEIVRGLLGELRALNGSGLCVYEMITIPYSPSSPVMNLDVVTDTTRLLGIYDVKSQGTDPTASVHGRVRWELLTDVELSEFHSGYALQVFEQPRGAANLRVIYKRTMADFAELDDEVDAPGYVQPILPVGAAWRLLLGQEARRVNARAEHGSRRAEEVPAGSNAFAARAFQSLRQDMIEDALEIQYRMYPLRQRDG